MGTTVAHHTGPVKHYAYYGELYGTAELLCGSGYLFREEGARTATLVSYKDASLMLLGRIDLADAQRALDGNLAAKVCGY